MRTTDVRCHLSNRDYSRPLDNVKVIRVISLELLMLCVSFTRHDKQQCSSVQSKTVSMHLEKVIYAPTRFSDVSQKFTFERAPMFVRMTMALSRPFKGNCVTPAGDRRSDILGCFSPADSVSSSSTLQNIRDANHLWGSFCPPVYLLGPLKACMSNHSKTHRTNERKNFLLTRVKE